MNIDLDHTWEEIRSIGMLFDDLGMGVVFYHPNKEVEVQFPNGEYVTFQQSAGSCKDERDDERYTAESYREAGSLDR